MYCTQCEAEGFRRITPFQDRPDIMARCRPRCRSAALILCLRRRADSDLAQPPRGCKFVIINACRSKKTLGGGSGTPQPSRARSAHPRADQPETSRGWQRAVARTHEMPPPPPLAHAQLPAALSSQLCCLLPPPSLFSTNTRTPPSLPSSYLRVRIEADKKACPVLLSNGNLVAQASHTSVPRIKRTQTVTPYRER